MSSVLTGFGVIAGFGLSFVLEYFFRKQKLKRAFTEAADIIQTARDRQEINQARILSRAEDYKTSLAGRRHTDQEAFFQNRRRLQSQIDKWVHQKKSVFHKRAHAQNKKKAELQTLSQALQEETAHLTVLQKQLKEKQNIFTQQLQKKFSVDMNQLKAHWEEEQKDRAKNKIIQTLTQAEAQFKQNIERSAAFILECVLSRFRQAGCPERGIKSVVFANQKELENILGPELSKLKELEKQCGVDMKLSDKEPAVSIFGIDPVRRELGRATLQKIAKKRYLKTENIKQVMQETKKEIFRQIHSDGEHIVRALKLPNIKQEVKNLMGALRYRYSFAQNQYFHCLEVGWLCGLLYSELGGKEEDGRRAGMLHDIGKAIDYSKEGGHAVIGADFIQKHGEAPFIVHAVRAHHHDVSPEQVLDFLVIAADALSGARPGARRSTVDSYNQKVLTLEKIGRSFDGVKDTYIMSAGREMRVIVDSKVISDAQALDLSKQITQKIEQECSYPGLIKVTVVRTVTCTAGPRQYAH